LQAGLQQIGERHEALRSFSESLQGRLDVFEQEGSRSKGQIEQLNARLGAFERELEQVRAEQSQQESENSRRHALWLASEQERQRLQQQLDQVLGSLSFRITKPLRSMGNFLRKSRSMMASAMRPVWLRMVHHAWGRRIGKMVTYPFPSLRNRLNQSIVMHVGHEEGGVPQNKVLSPGGTRIYDQLQQGMKDDSSHGEA
jgi:hypothetical protein